MNHSNEAQKLRSALNLEPHIEGGYFRRTYCSDYSLTTHNLQRTSMSSIFYMLTQDSPMGRWHLNASDIMHYYHLGDPIEYFLIDKNGHLEHITMGTDYAHGQNIQMCVPGGVWKAAKLNHINQGFGLISEAVTPGFEYEDMQIGVPDKLCELFPKHTHIINQFDTAKEI